jgi:16S rRNA U1498 N3-methylase RsmE
LAPDELALAGEAGFETASLGRWTLRADTAVAVALARYAPS